MMAASDLFSDEFRVIAPIISSQYHSITRQNAGRCRKRKTAMAWIPVVSYYVRYNTTDRQPIIGIYYNANGNGEGKLQAQHFSVSAQDALFIADMLRNEGPVYYDPASGALASGKETIGEGETREDGS
jgi:hypothetical protein